MECRNLGRIINRKEILTYRKTSYIANALDTGSFTVNEDSDYSYYLGYRLVDDTYFANISIYGHDKDNNNGYEDLMMKLLIKFPNDKNANYVIGILSNGYKRDSKIKIATIRYPNRVGARLEFVDGSNNKLNISSDLYDPTIKNAIEVDTLCMPYLNLNISNSREDFELAERGKDVLNKYTDALKKHNITYTVAQSAYVQSDACEDVPDKTNVYIICATNSTAKHQLGILKKHITDLASYSGMTIKDYMRHFDLVNMGPWTTGVNEYYIFLYTGIPGDTIPLETMQQFNITKELRQQVRDILREV